MVMMTVQLKMERMTKAQMVIFPSIVAFSNAKRNAPLASKGEMAISVMSSFRLVSKAERRQAGAAQCSRLGDGNCRVGDA